MAGLKRRCDSEPAPLSGADRVSCAPAIVATAGSRRPSSRGFSLIELLVVLGVAWLLISLLMPSFARIREAARRVACASNMHQLAIALESYSRDSRNRLPNSYFAGDRYRAPKPQEMMILNRAVRRDTWDGMGRLYSKNYIGNAGVYYCPSYIGDHTMRRYEGSWKRESHDLIFGNYQYRGMLNLASQTADPIDRYDRDQLRHNRPAGLSLLADGLRTKSDFSHVRGCNILEDDLSISWFSDENGKLYSILPDNLWEDWPRGEVWFRLDQGLTGD